MDNDELRNKLETEYGIQIYHEDLSEEEIKRHGYRKMTEEEASHFDAIFQFAPHVIKDAYYSRVFQDSFNAAVQGSYKVKIGQGLHLGKSHTTPGAFKGNAYDKNNNLKTQADWFVNDAQLDVSMAPQIASFVFNAAAFITGQYFMTEINRSLSEIKTDTKDIKQFLENDKYGTIKAAINSLIEIIHHLKFIEADSERIDRTLQELKNINFIAEKYISISQQVIEQERAKTRNDDKSDIIKKHVKTVADYIKQYRVLVELYCQSKLLIIYLDNVWSIEELSQYRDELNKVVNEYLFTYKNFTYWINSYIDQNNSLNKRGIGQIVVSAGASTIPYLLGGLSSGMILGSSMSESVNNLMDVLRNEKKYRHEEYARGLMNSVGSNHYAVKKPIIRLNRYIEIAENGIEIVRIGDSVYTNLPEEIL